MQNGLFDSFNPEVVQDYFANGEPFASLDPSYMTVGLLRQCAALGIKTVTLPIPNELGGVTAEIGSYAMGNRNTKHPTEVKALLAYAPSISGSDEYWMVGFSERAIDNDGFPALDDFTLLVRSKKN